ncbi:MAG: hypothetical protein ACLFQP_10965 [Halothece sp.]
MAAYISTHDFFWLCAIARQFFRSRVPHTGEDTFNKFHQLKTIRFFQRSP